MKKSRLQLTLAGLLLSGPAGSFDMSNVPLFVTSNVAPNLVLTLDDSGSMRRAFVPEHCNDASDCEALDNRWSKAANGNALYYNPDVYYPPPFNADLSRRTTSFGAAWRNGYYPEAGSVNLGTDYRPTAGLQMNGNFSCAGNGGSSSGDLWFECHMGHYSDDLGTLGAASVSSPAKAHYYNYNTGLPSCKTLPVASRKNANECYQLVIVGASSGPGLTDINGDSVVTAQDRDERQNFANWYSFYRTRNLAVISAASLAFANLSATSRLSWQALNTCRDSPSSLVTRNCNGWSGSFGSNAINVFGNAAHRQNFYGWLSRLPMSGDTPLREALIRAGEYFKTTGENSPYDNDLSAGNSDQYSCRRNFHILMTDGIWNDSLSDIGDIDGQSIPGLPDEARTPYDAKNKAYGDSTRNTLSDLAFKYWATDLVPSLPNKLTPLIEAQDDYDALGHYGTGNGIQDTTQQIFWNARNNPATWQHMVNFTIGLGLTDYLQKAGLNWTGDMYGGSYLDLMNGSKNWPPATESMGRWGDEYGKSAHDLWHAAINSRGRFFSVESPQALRDAFERILSMVEAATPTAAALASNSTNTSSNAGQKTRVFQARFDTRYWNGSLYALEVEGQTGAISGPVWDAGAKLNQLAASNGRKIFMRGKAGAANLGWSNLTPAQQTALNQSDGNGSLRLNWLRGDHSKEQRFIGGLFRNRTAFELNYDGTMRQTGSEWLLGDIVASDPLYVGTGSQQYDLLPAGAPGRDSYTAYVSAKASRTPMIYVGANDGMLHAFRATDGVEQFAVIPNAVFPNLHQLTKPSYTHRHYVDGSPSGGDAFLGGAWKTVVVTGLRAGGKSVFAVDATQADNPTASQFMWEFNADGSDDNMGYSYSQPQVVRLNDGNWAAVFGNGYNSKNGGVSLYIVNLADGSLIKRIEAVKNDVDNGLSTPTLVDTDGDRIVDTAYAGDLKGKVWKFDLKSGSASNWSGSGFFTAQDGSGNPQPITVQPNVVKGDRGYWVFFGTGRMLSSTDIAAAAMSKRQSFYGLWDNNTAIAGRSALVEQTVTGTASKNGMNLRVTSNNEVNLTVKRGWYMDLPSSGERVTAEAATVIDNVNQDDNRIVFTTAIPSADPCNAQGTSWLMELSFKGRRPTQPAFDLNSDLKFDSGDTVLDGVIPTGMQSTVGIMDSVTWLDRDADVAFKLAPGTKGKVQTIANRGRGLGGRSRRVSWQQLM